MYQCEKYLGLLGTFVGHLRTDTLFSVLHRFVAVRYVTIATMISWTTSNALQRYRSTAAPRMHLLESLRLQSMHHAICSGPFLSEVGTWPHFEPVLDVGTGLVLSAAHVCTQLQLHVSGTTVREKIPVSGSQSISIH